MRTLKGHLPQKKVAWIAIGLMLLALLALPLSALTTTSKVEASSNCTYTQGFWKTHPSSWPVTSLTMGGKTYSQAELLQIFNTAPKGDATYILADQLIAAKLNLANGADTSVVSATMAQADAWLAANPLGSKPKGAANTTGISLGNTLDQFNNGLIGPGHCDAAPVSTPTPTPTPTPTICGYDYSGNPIYC
jgi:hypothetical protein